MDYVKQGTGLVSIVVPIYNVEKYLPQCIESLLNQTMKELQIILVDDGSTDSSGSICDQFAQIDPRIQVIHQTNKGLVAARKAGAALAYCDYIACVDGDDFVEPSMYATLYRKITESAAQMAVCGYYQYDENTSQRKVCLPLLAPGVYDHDFVKREVLETIFVKYTITPNVWSKLFERTMYLRCLNNVDDAIVQGEDIAVTYQMLLYMQRMVIADELLYNYRILPDSMSHGYRKNFWQSVSMLQELFLKCAQEQKNDQLRRGILLARVDNVLRWIQNESRNEGTLKWATLLGQLRQVLNEGPTEGWSMYKSIMSLAQKEKVILILAEYGATYVILLLILLMRARNRLFTAKLRSDSL